MTSAFTGNGGGMPAPSTLVPAMESMPPPSVASLETVVGIPPPGAAAAYELAIDDSMYVSDDCDGTKGTHT